MEDDQLTPEEEKELMELEAEFGESAPEPESPYGEIQPGQTHWVNPETKRTEPLPEDLQRGEELQPVDSLVAGMAEGIPGVKDTIAASKAAFSGDEGNFGEKYQQNLQEINEFINKAEQANPKAFMTGDIGAGVAAGAVTGPTLKAAALFGGLSGVSRSESREPADMLVEASKGAGLGLGAAWGSQKLIQGINKSAPFKSLAKKFGLLADEATVDAIAPGAQRKRLNEGLRKIYNTWDDSQGKMIELSPDEITKRFVSDLDSIKVNGKPLMEVADTVDDTLMKFKQLKETTLGKYVNSLDEAEAVIPEEKLFKIFERHKQSLNLDTLRKIDPKKAAQLEKKVADIYYNPVEEFEAKIVKKTIKGANGEPLLTANGQPIYEDVIEQVPKSVPKLKQMTLKDLDDYRRFFGDQTKKARSGQGLSVDSSDFEIYNRGTGVLSDEIEGFIPNVGEFKETKKMLRIARLGEDITQRTSDAIAKNKGPLAQLKNAINFRSMMFMAAGGLGGGNRGAAVGYVLSKLSNAAKDPNTNIKVASKLRNLSKAIEDGIGDQYLKRLAVASSLSESEFNTELAAIGGELELAAKPLKRDFQSVLEMSDSVLEALQPLSPELASQLREAIDNKDQGSVGAIMDHVSKMPEAQGLVEDGMGWDGKVFDPKEKALLADQLQKDPSISFADKLMLKKELEENGTIPVARPKESSSNFLQYMSRKREQY